MSTSTDFVRVLLDLCGDGNRGRDTYVQIARFLRGLGVLGRKDELKDVTTVLGWQRGGSESYICIGDVSALSKEGASVRRMIAKTYVGFGLGVPIEERVENWHKRAIMLGNKDVSIPYIYSAARGVLLCEYIRHEFTSWVVSINERSQRGFAEELVRIVEQLASVAGRCTSILHNLRTDGNKIFLIDFGEDLGEMPTFCKPRQLFTILTREVSRNCSKDFHDLLVDTWEERH